MQTNLNKPTKNFLMTSYDALILCHANC